MLFEQRFWPGLRDGSVTMTFRRWRRPQAVAGRRYRTPAGIIEVDSVESVDRGTDDEARRAGYESWDALAAGLRGDADVPLTKVTFHLVDEPDPRDALANDDTLDEAAIAEIDRRLDRLDRASKHGPWTEAVLASIGRDPGRRAGDLAERFGRERLSFKADVRKLKNLGLTISLETGYRLSPRGAAYLAAIEHRRRPGTRGAHPL